MVDHDIVMDHVTYTYPDSERPAISNISLSVKKGEVLLITGPSGAGKTSLCSCLNGLVPHFYGGKLEGEVLVKGYKTKKHGLGMLSSIVGLLFQDPASQLVCPTVEDEIAFGLENYGVPIEEIDRRVKEFMKYARLERYAKRNPFTLSGGEQQACALAAIIAMRPSIYVLDEPTSNLDPLGSHKIFRLIERLVREENKTCIIVEHKIEDLMDIVDRIIVMDGGRIILDGTPRQVLENIELLERIGLKPPQVTILVERLRKDGIEIPGKLPLTLEEARENLSKILREKVREKSRPIVLKEKKEITESPVIKCGDLWHVYPGGTVALRGIDLRIHRGEYIAIIGANGSGKTTLVKHFNALLKPTKGKVFVDGVDTATAPTERLARKVAYCFQNPDDQIFSLTVRKELAFGPKNLGLSPDEIERRIKKVAERMGLEHTLDLRPYSLSKGERQKLAVASIIAMEPEVLIIDEPTTGQDYKRGREMMGLATELNREGKTVIIITHDMNLVAEYVKRVIVMQDGKIICDGPTRHVYSKPEMLAKTYLKPPQITLLLQELREFGLSGDILTVDEALGVLKQVISG